MRRLEDWGTSNFVIDEKIWESYFPGRGSQIVQITSLFHNWIPTFGPPDIPLEQEIRLASPRPLTEVHIVPLSQADEAQSLVTLPISRLFSFLYDDPEANWSLVNEVVGTVFGPVIGGNSPEVMLRAWAYSLIIDALTALFLNKRQTFEQIQKVLELWRRGNYFMGLDTRTEPPGAIVVVADPV